jgi:dihydroorotate dehydrogenase (NAD+) catalytic subunit
MSQSYSIYDASKDFSYNVTYGPFWEGKLPPKFSPKKSSQQKKHSFLGHPLNSVFGVSSSPMTFTARNIEFCARLGYDLITYRSVRSVEWHGLGAPNWVFIDAPKQFLAADLKKPVLGSLTPFPNQEISTANSFGIQSFRPEYWQAEYEKAKKSLSKGQLLILALMITPEDGRDAVQDATEVAKLANETSAEIFEINLACPNSGSKALIYEELETSIEVCKAIKKVIGKKDLIAKVGLYADMKMMKEFMAKTKGVLAGLTSVNTYSMKIQDKDGKDVFPGRPIAGVSGAAIRTLAIQQAQKIVEFKKELGLKRFAVIGVGGVTKPEHIQEYLDVGVDAVQAVNGVWADPYLAQKWKTQK